MARETDNDGREPPLVAETPVRFTATDAVEEHRVLPGVA
jgi:hypothetical protein